MPISGGSNIGVSPKWISFTFTIEGEAQTRRYIENFGLRVSNVSPLLERFGNYMLGSFGNRFAGEKGRISWAQLAPSTVRARGGRYGYYKNPSSQGASHLILQWTGELMRSFTIRNAYGNVFLVNGNSLIVGSQLNKAHYHHHGSPNMPSRRVAFLDNKDNTYLTKLFHEHLKSAVQQRGRQVFESERPYWTQMR